MTTASARQSDRLLHAWEAHKDRLWRALLAWAGDPEVASEAVAEAFAQAARRGEAIDDVGRWVWKSAFRIAAGMLADRRRDDNCGLPGVEPTAAGMLTDEVHALVDALDRLRPEDREVVVLAHVGGWSSEEIAALTGSTSGAVRVRLHRARQQLREALEENDA